MPFTYPRREFFYESGSYLSYETEEFRKVDAPCKKTQVFHAVG